MLPFLISIFKPYTRSLLLAAVAIVIVACNVIAIGWGVRYLVDHGFAEGRADYLNKALLFLLGFVMIQAFATYTRFYTVNSVVEKAMVTLRQTLFNHLIVLPPNAFDKITIGDMLSRLTSDIQLVQTTLSQSAPIALRNILLLMGTFVMLILTNASLLAIVLIAIPVVIIPIIFIGRKVKAKSKQSQNSMGVITEFSNETLQALKTVQSYTQEKMIADLYAQKISHMNVEMLSYIKLRAGLTAFVIAIVFTAIGIVLWRGGHDVLTGVMTAGELSSFILYAIFMVGAVGALSEEISAFNRAAGAIERILELFKITAKTGSNESLPPHQITGEISFRHVHFSYPQRADDIVLRDISFDIKPNQTVAIVGPSGAGKTTIFLLLQKFHAPSAGEIMIDGMNIQNISDYTLRQQTALVSQDIALFAMSVHDNIAFGAIRVVSREEVIRAAQQAHIHDEIMALPAGYDTILKPQGGNLSGGQRQRIAIARAIIRESKILLLDEATSALDAENERHIQSAMQTVKGGRTVIFIAHRLSTVRNADHIIVMDQGQIIDEGKHDDLIAKGGLYYKLASLQFSGS